MIHGIWRTTSIAANAIKYCGVGERKVRGWARLRPRSHEQYGHLVGKSDVVPKTGPSRATWTNPKFPISR